MKKLLLNLKVVMTLLLLIGATNVWGEDITYNMTIDSSNSGNNNVHWTSSDVSALTYAGITWNTSVVGTTSVTASKTYCQIGSKSNPAKQVTISTNDFAGKTIKSIAVTCYCMSNTGPKLTVTAGSTTMINAVSLTKTTSTEIKSAEGTSATLGSNDNLTITFNSSASAAICISKVEVTYEESTTPTKTLSSIAVSGTPTKTEYYDGDVFDPTGLTVTGTYDDESQETITSGIEWTVTPSTLTTETTSVSVVAKVSEIESDPFVVNDLTVNEFVQTYANTYTSGEGLLSTIDGTSASECTINWDGTDYDGIKAGTGKAAGAIKIAIPTGTKTLHMHIVGWNGEKVEVTLTAGTSTTSYTLTSDAGLSGNSPFKLQNDPETNDYFTYDVAEGVSQITLTATSGNRFAIFGVNAEAGTTPTTGPTITCADITGVSYEGVTDAVATPTFNNNEGWMATVACDRIIVTSATLNDDNTITYTVSENSTTDVRDGSITITLKKYGEESVEKVVKVSQLAKPVAYASLAELVAAGEPTTAGVDVTVTLTDEVITKFYKTGNYTNGVYLQVGEREIEIYCKDVPTEWAVGGTISGTITCPWTEYKGTWELCPTSWEGLTYTPSTAEKYAIEIDEEIENGTVEANVEEAAEGEEITLTATPDAGYEFSEWYVLDGDANEVAVTNNKFIMPASNVTVSATFTAIPTHYVMYTSLGEEVGEGEEVYEGSCIANAPEVTAPEGWTFIGWTTNDEYTMSTTSPELFSASTPVTEDLILCAVFSKTEGGADSEPALVKMVSGDTFEDGDKIVIVAHDTEVALYRETVNTSYVNKYTFDENINTVLADEKNYVTVKAIEGGYALGIYPSSNNLYAQDDNVSDIWTLNDLKDGTFKIQSNERNLSYRSDLTNMYWRMGGANYGTSGKTVLDLYKVSTGIAGTTVYTIAAPQTYNVEITDAKYATLGLPYAVTIPEGVSAYVASAAEGNSVTMDALEGVIPANTGVVLYSETPATYTFTETAADAYEGQNLMVAVTEDGGKQIGGNGTDYVLALKDGAVKFYEANEGTIAQYKAYLQMSTAGVKELNINFNGGEANGIRTIISNDNAKTNAIYNLNGQRLNSLQKGLNIVNGKKLFIK